MSSNSPDPSTSSKCMSYVREAKQIFGNYY